MNILEKTTKILAAFMFMAAVLCNTGAAVAKEDGGNLFEQSLAQKKGVVNFSITVSSTLPKKAAVIIYNVASFGSDKQGTYNSVNYTINTIHKRIRDKLSKNVKIETINRRTSELVDGQFTGGGAGWETIQTEKIITDVQHADEALSIIESSNAEVVSTTYKLPEKEREAFKERAQKEAVEKWLSEADKLSKIMKAKEWWVNSMNISLTNNFGRITPMYKAMAAPTSAAMIPETAGGEEKVTVQVTGSIQVKF